MIVTRFPPSPTGAFHIGSARTALFNYLFAAHHGGVMRLRFEDTDRERSHKEFENDIIEGLHWLGISYSPPITRQSERTELYRKYCAQLIDRGFAYEAEEATDQSGRVIRFKNPKTTIVFTDLIRGSISTNTSELGDFIVARSINDPLYHLAVVIDDHDAGVTHVIRGEDHISNTPRQILLLEALGFRRPLYAHIPLILAPDRSKLSKRHGATSINEYRQKGFLPEALINYLALLGWNPGTDQELFSIKELIAAFDIAHIQHGGAIFNIEKLRWFNRQYLQRMEQNAVRDYFMPAITKHLIPRGFLVHDIALRQLIELCLALFTTREDFIDAISRGELDYLFQDPVLAPHLIPEKKSDQQTAARHLRHVREVVEALPQKSFSSEALKHSLWEYASREGRGAVLWPLRYALTGRERSPDPFVIASLIGKEATLRRVDIAITILES